MKRASGVQFAAALRRDDVSMSFMRPAWRCGCVDLPRDFDYKGLAFWPCRMRLTWISFIWNSAVSSPAKRACEHRLHPQEPDIFTCSKVAGPVVLRKCQGVTGSPLSRGMTPQIPFDRTPAPFTRNRSSEPPRQADAPSGRCAPG